MPPIEIRLGCMNLEMLINLRGLKPKFSARH